MIQKITIDKCSGQHRAAIRAIEKSQRDNRKPVFTFSGKLMHIIDVNEVNRRQLSLTLESIM